MPPQHGPNRGRPTPGHPRVQRTRGHILAVARELLPEVGSAGLTYSMLADRAGVTRQTLYRRWPARAALLVDLILAVPEVGFPEPGSDPRAVATAWLTSLAAGLNDQATRAAVLAVTARADLDPDSAPALRGSAPIAWPRSTSCSRRQAVRPRPRSTHCSPGRSSPGFSSTGPRSPASSPTRW